MRLLLVFSVSILTLCGCSGEKTKTLVATQKAQQPSGKMLLQRAKSYASDGKPIDDLLKHAEELLEAKPESPDLLGAATVLSFVIANEAMRNGKRDVATSQTFKALDYLIRLQKLEEMTDEVKPIVSDVYVNAARAAAYSGENERALTLIDSAADFGFVDPRILESDIAFEKFDKNDPKFEALLHKLKGKLVDFELKVRLPNVDGEFVSTTDFQGSIVAAYIWGTWDTNSLLSLSELNKLQTRYKDDGLQILGINIENVSFEDAPRHIKAFLKDRPINFPTVIGEREMLKVIPYFNQMPTTIFLDRNGKVRDRISGRLTRPAFENIVRPLLAEETTGPKNVTE